MAFRDEDCRCAACNLVSGRLQKLCQHPVMASTKGSLGWSNSVFYHASETVHW
jgi:hypothetical protein